jgi:adenylate kinase family enzyme
MLRASDPLPHAPRRILLAGVSGSGKTTLARLLASRLGIAHTEIDALYHGPNWSRRDEFYTDVETLVAGDAWITEWQYRSVRPMLADRADTLVWLDFPVRLWLPRLLRRTIRRRRTREKLWADNLEPPLWHLVTGRDHVISWSLRTHREYRALIADVEASHPRLQVVQLRNQVDVDRWLSRLTP